MSMRRVYAQVRISGTWVLALGLMKTKLGSQFESVPVRCSVLRCDSCEALVKGEAIPNAVIIL